MSGYDTTLRPAREEKNERNTNGKFPEPGIDLMAVKSCASAFEDPHVKKALAFRARL